MARELNLHKALIKKIIFTAIEPLPLWHGGMARAEILIFCSLKNGVNWASDVLAAIRKHLEWRLTTCTMLWAVFDIFLLAQNQSNYADASLETEVPRWSSEGLAFNHLSYYRTTTPRNLTRLWEKGGFSFTIPTSKRCYEFKIWST